LIGFLSYNDFFVFFFNYGSFHHKCDNQCYHASNLHETKDEQNQLPAHIEMLNTKGQHADTQYNSEPNPDLLVQFITRKLLPEENCG
jgi:heterodisulfide reductase subunit B